MSGRANSDSIAAFTLATIRDGIASWRVRKVIQKLPTSLLDHISCGNHSLFRPHESTNG